MQRPQSLRHRAKKTLCGELKILPRLTRRISHKRLFINKQKPRVRQLQGIFLVLWIFIKPTVLHVEQNPPSRR